MVRHAIRLAPCLALLVAGLVAVAPAPLKAGSDPLATPTMMVRFYFHALGTGQCDLASKFAATTRSLNAFRRSCRGIRKVVVEQLNDPGYRFHPQNAAYTCLALRYTVYRRSGVATYGGWYLMERTLGPAWHILYALSHLTKGGSATHLTKAQCASHLPAYVQPGSATVISGSAFLPGTAGWIARSTSGSYLPSGSCSHGIGTNCDGASTVVYRTDDAGKHWTPMLRFRDTGPPVWLRLFNPREGLVAAAVGPLTSAANQHSSAALFRTQDGGRHWQRFPLPPNYATLDGTISFPDLRHGWLWYGGGAGGSMPVDMYRTSDGGRHWCHVACTSFSNTPSSYRCPHQSGIQVGGDKTNLTFKDAHHGWLEAQEGSGVPAIYYTPDGGTTWRGQAVGPPPGVERPSATTTVFPYGTLLPPRFFGQTGILPEVVGFSRATPPANWSRLYIYRSTDDGRTWDFAVRTPVTGFHNLWQTIDAHHWLLLSNDAIWSTSNGGASWIKHSLHLPPGLMLVSLEFTSATDGWATAQKQADSGVSTSGTVLLHTIDGGVYWTKTTPPRS